jgi:hypothetical protein
MSRDETVSAHGCISSLAFEDDPVSFLCQRPCTQPPRANIKFGKMALSCTLSCNCIRRMCCFQLGQSNLWNCLNFKQNKLYTFLSFRQDYLFTCLWQNNLCTFLTFMQDYLFTCLRQNNLCTFPLLLGRIISSLISGRKISVIPLLFLGRIISSLVSVRIISVIPLLFFR